MDWILLRELVLQEHLAVLKQCDWKIEMVMKMFVTKIGIIWEFLQKKRGGILKPMWVRLANNPIFDADDASP